MIDEIADLIVQGKNREAYEKLREWSGLNSWDQRERMIAGRNANVEQVDHDILISRHNRAINHIFPSPIAKQNIKPRSPRK